MAKPLDFAAVGQPIAVRPNGVKAKPQVFDLLAVDRLVPADHIVASLLQSEGNGDVGMQVA